jgi:hypothetical protein
MPSYSDGYRPLPGNHDWKPRESAASRYFAAVSLAEQLQILHRAAERSTNSAITARRAAEQAEEAAAELTHMIDVIQGQLSARESTKPRDGIDDPLWNEAIDWLLNSRHTADPDIQTAFWGMVDGRFTRKQADNGVFEYDADGNAHVPSED